MVFKTKNIHSDAKTRLFQNNLLLIIRYSKEGDGVFSPPTLEATEAYLGVWKFKF